MLIVQRIVDEGEFLAPHSKVETYEVEGISLPHRYFPPSTIEALKTWEARTDDVFVVSFPKAGKMISRLDHVHRIKIAIM